VRPDRVVEVAEAVDLDGEGIAVADVGTVEVFVLQGAEEPFDDAVGLGERTRVRTWRSSGSSPRNTSA
jgi:hypothetical protein